MSYTRRQFGGGETEAGSDFEFFGLRGDLGFALAGDAACIEPDDEIELSSSFTSSLTRFAGRGEESEPESSLFELRVRVFFELLDPLDRPNPSRVDSVALDSSTSPSSYNVTEVLNTLVRDLKDDRDDLEDSESLKLECKLGFAMVPVHKKRARGRRAAAEQKAKLLRMVVVIIEKQSGA